MLLDLWSFAIILNDIFEFVIYWAEHETFTVSFGLATLTFFVLAYFAWRSTDIPHDVPSPPRPPFIITIQGTTLNNGGRRQSLSDVHILRNTSSYAHHSSEVRRRTTRGSQATEGSEEQENPATDETPLRNQSSSPILRPSLHGTRSLFFGLLRRRAVNRPILPTRPLLRSRFSQGPSLVVYHRIYHPPTPAQSGLPSSNSTEAVSPPSSVNTPSNQDGNLRTVEANRVDTVTEQLIPEGSIGTSAPTTSVLDGRPEPNETPQVDSCRVLERSYSDSDLNLSELVYRRSELSTTMDKSGKLDPTQNQTPTDNPAEMSNSDVKFTLKFLNDTQKDVTTQFNEKIGDFKRRHFETELSQNKVVRLIFNGRVLDNDSKTLRESGIFDQCVVHCLIVTPQPSQQSQSASGPATQRYGSRSGSRGPEPGMFFVSFMGIILVFLWFICFNFGQQLFTQSAVVSLSVLTAIFLIGLVAFYLPVHPANPTTN